MISGRTSAQNVLPAVVAEAVVGVEVEDSMTIEEEDLVTMVGAQEEAGYVFLILGR